MCGSKTILEKIGEKVAQRFLREGSEGGAGEETENGREAGIKMERPQNDEKNLGKR